MSIEELRTKIDEIDYQILSLLSQRLRIAKKIGELKGIKGAPVKDEKREREVVKNWIENARKLEIPEDLALSVLNDILFHSRKVQVGVKSPYRITVIGYGGMGRALARLFSSVGNNVVITGRNPDKAQEASKETGSVAMPLKSAVEWGDYVILALPPEALKDQFMEKVYPDLKGKTVMDIASSKRIVFDVLERRSEEHSFRFVSTHPLFGPYSNPIGERVVLIRSKTSGEMNDVKELWRSAGLNVVETDLETHERAMAVVQVLSHFFVLGLRESYKKASQVLDVGNVLDDLQTVTYRELTQIIERLSKQEDVVMEIQRLNPYAFIAREIGFNTLKDLYERLGRDAIHPKEGGGLVDPKGKVER
mgnify:FL=1